MASRPKSSITMAMRRTRRKSISHRRLCKPRKSSRQIANVRVDPCSTVSDKLEALKNLIPSTHNEEIKADQLFQETAKYIVLLKTQVTILQKLIDFYGSSDQVQQNQDAV